MICGGVAGMVAKTATNPLERIKMLSQTGGGGSGSIVGIYKSILQREGILGLWAGNGANLIRIVPNKAVVFSTQDLYKDLFRRFVVVNSSGSNNPHQPLPPIYSFLAGGLAGMTATAATYPLDLARGRISGTLASSSSSAATNSSATTATTAAAQQPTKVYKGLVQTMVVTVKDEGIAGLYKGIAPTMLGAMPYVGIQFGTVAVLEKLFPKTNSSSTDHYGGSQEPATPSSTTNSSGQKALRKMLFGGIGGVTAGLITYPNDTVRRMLQLQGARHALHESAAPQFSGYWDCVVQTYRTQGVGRFYRGLTINLIRMAPNTAVQFGTYEFLSQATASWTAA
jgi:Mitochondrial carrier protein